MHNYFRKVQYYETDQTGVVHHSNYIRWFEEARVDYLDKIGLSYFIMDEKGFISPVLSAKCTYLLPCKFGEDVAVECSISEFTNIRFTVKYKVFDAKSLELRAMGKTMHCFLDVNGKPISIKRKDPELFEKLKTYVEVEF